jgi:hypothetical protein
MVALMFVALVAACSSGGDGDTPPAPTAATGSVAVSPTPGRTAEATATRPATSVPPTETPEPPATAEAGALARFNAIEPISPEPAGNPADDLLGGTPNTAAAEAITQALGAAGFSLQGIKIYVFPVTGTDESLMVLNFHEDQQPALGDDAKPFISAVIGAADAQALNVPRTAMNYFGSDELGPYRVTMAAPTQVLRDLASGAITEEAAAAQIAYEVVR